MVRARLDWLSLHLAREDFSDTPGLRGRLLRHLQVIWLAARGLHDDRIQLRTARLSLVTLFSLVPLLALVFSVFQAFGGLEAVRARVESFIYANIAVGAQQSFFEAVETFVGRINGGALGSLGGIFLLFAAVRLVHAIEEAFDELWGVHERRRLFDRVVTYWAVITLGPLLLATTLAGSDVLQGWMQTRVALPAPLFKLVPPTLTVVGFAVLYYVLPSARVRFRYALAGAFLAGLAFEAAKATYAWVAIGFFRYDAVFGSLGAVPVFIIWVEIAWLILLLGCKIAFAYQNHSTLRQEEVATGASPRLRERLAARLVLTAASRFRQGEPPSPVWQLAQAAGAPIRLTHQILEVLCEASILRAVQTEDGRETGYVPARPPDRLTVGAVLSAVREHGDPELELLDSEHDRSLDELLSLAESASVEVAGSVDFRSLVTGSWTPPRDRPADEPPAGAPSSS